MNKENLHNQALLEEFKQSWEHLRHIENQRWKIFMIFGTLCGGYAGLLSVAGSFNKSLSITIIFLSCLFFQVFASIILLILLKWRYEFCHHMKDLVRKRIKFGFCLAESVMVGEKAPTFFKSDSVHWFIIAFFWLVEIGAVCAPIVFLLGVKRVLLLLGPIVSAILLGVGIGFFLGLKIRFKGVTRFFRKYEMHVPELLCPLLVLLAFGTLYLYVYWKNDILFILTLQFITLIITVAWFVALWIKYVKRK